MICSGRDAASGEFIEIEFDEVIRGVRRVKPAEANAETWIAPGFIDIQVNGFAGVDFNRASTPHSEIQKALELIVSTGVTRCLPTVITGPKDDMVGCLGNLAAAKKAVPLGKTIAGFHVEGPHIASVDGPRGAHPLDSVRPPDLEEYKRWQEATEGQIRLITLSAEYDRAPDYIRTIVRDGVTASIGHTAATSDQIRAAVDAGATLSTHLGNAAHSVMPKHPNYIWDQMAEDRLSASFIVDGIHLGAAFLKSAVRAKTVARAVLVTDASAPAGTKPGRYVLGRQTADLTEDGRVVLAGTDRLAGSALKMNDGIANVMRMAGISLSEACAMATIHPARVVRLEGRLNWLVTGERADFAVFRTGRGIAIDSVYIDGKRAV